MASDIPVIVVGGGLSGLACGYSLKQAGIEVLVLEASHRPGGVISTRQQDGFLVEEGPQSFLCTSELLALVRALGIEAELLRADSRAPRYILLGGRLLAVPLSPLGFVRTPLLTGRSKWALVRGLLQKTQPPDEDESLAAFVRRKFTDELLENLVGPMVSGIYAGDPERLSMRATFPMVYELELQYGSLFRGAMRARGRGKGERLTLSTFRGGNETLLRTLGEKLGASLKCGPRVAEIRREPADVFSVRVEGADGTTMLRTTALVLATEPHVAGQLLGGLSPDFSRFLGEIEYAPVAEVALGYEQRQIGGTSDGFGFLVPRHEGLRVLGTVWNSSLFPGRAPEGAALTTSFVGGALDPDGAALDAQMLVGIVHSEIARVMKIDGWPVFQSVRQYPRALPQYNLGHAARIEAAEKLAARFPGLWLAGNYLEGPAMGACVKRAARVARRAQEFLAERPAMATPQSG